jgi:galactose-1-phosphate uridylyltransferase
MSPKELITNILRDLNRLAEHVECGCEETSGDFGRLERYACANHKIISVMMNEIRWLRRELKESA